MEIENKIRSTIASIISDQDKQPLADLNHDSVLLETGLDSLGYAILVTRLEDELGYDPFAMMETPYYPQTFGQFVELYEKYAQ